MANCRKTATLAANKTRGEEEAEEERIKRGSARGEEEEEEEEERVKRETTKGNIRRHYHQI